MKPPKTPNLIDFLSSEMGVIDPDEKSKFGLNLPD
jgi:hypothetical protein